MARLPRLSVGGVVHLVLQRGLAGLHVFADAQDRQLYLETLVDAAQTEGVVLHAYSILTEEVRLLATPSNEQALGRMMQAVGRRYGAIFNRRHRRNGALWEGRFRCTLIESDHYLLPATLFVEEPAWLLQQAQGVGVAEDALSSLPHHLGVKSDRAIKEHAGFWTLGNTPFDREIAYRKLVDGGLAGAMRAKLLEAALKGWPLGSVDFISRLGARTERRLLPLKKGRPRKIVQGD